MKQDTRHAVGFDAHFDIPAMLTRRSQAFQDRFFCRPHPREVFGRLPPSLAIANLSIGECSSQKCLAVTVDHGTNADAFDHVIAKSEYLHDDAPDTRMTLREE